MFTQKKPIFRILTTLLLVLTLVLGACAPGEETGESTPTQAVETDLELTLEELAEFDGQDGRRAYVAVDGVIYDFTDLDGWQGGEHQGFDAGQDLTDEIDDVSPHGRSVLDRATVVGRLVD